jgi:adenylosuccinate synthase
MTKIDVLLGLQWGDEGKGKIVDYLAPKYDVVARFQGGPNAGHTLEFDNIKHVLHQIPSGIFRPVIQNIIGNGVVLDAVIFKKEVESLAAYRTDVLKNLFISKKAQLILPTHRLLDDAQEKAKGENKIGSTLRGIGPSYQDKIGRQGLRVGDILSVDFKEKYEALKETHEAKLSFYNYSYDLQSLEEAFFEAVEFMKKFKLVDSEYFLNDKLKAGAYVLAEGAQGSLLDIDFGSYPFVTSSTTIASGACTGLGISPKKIGEVYGIFKAYCTRVGSGPFPTELSDATGEKLRAIGREFGATTQRPRRCGWLDIPALKYTVMLNGVTQLFMMKADVLNNFEEIKVCTHYKLKNGEVTDMLPYDITTNSPTPVYKSFKGWNCSLENIDDFNHLPDELLSYISYLEATLEVPVSIISIGPGRHQTLTRNEVLA